MQESALGSHLQLLYCNSLAVVISVPPSLVDGTTPTAEKVNILNRVSECDNIISPEVFVEDVSGLVIGDMSVVVGSGRCAASSVTAAEDPVSLSPEVSEEDVSVMATEDLVAT